MKKSASQAFPRCVNRGVLSIELVIILAVIAIIVIFIFANSGSLFRKNDVTMELSNAQEIMTNTRTLLKTQGGYEFTDNKQMTGLLIKVGGVPNSMTINGKKEDGTATVTNVWGGSVTVTPEKIDGSATNTGFSLTYEKVPLEACITMATKLSQTSAVSKTMINKKGGNAASKEGTGGEYTEAVKISEASKDCQADKGNTGTNVLIFTSNT